MTNPYLLVNSKLKQFPWIDQMGMAPNYWLQFCDAYVNNKQITNGVGPLAPTFGLYPPKKYHTWRRKPIFCWWNQQFCEVDGIETTIVRYFTVVKAQLFLILRYCRFPFLHWLKPIKHNNIIKHDKTM
jgi:hypothetical protein